MTCRVKGADNCILIRYHYNLRRNSSGERGGCRGRFLCYVLKQLQKLIIGYVWRGLVICVPVVYAELSLMSVISIVLLFLATVYLFRYFRSATRTSDVMQAMLVTEHERARISYWGFESLLLSEDQVGDSLVDSQYKIGVIRDNLTRVLPFRENSSGQKRRTRGIGEGCRR